ncbi:ABC transporter permease [Alloalcanivorax marinus]|uniref:ABC transporter permease n=1 Tax=Alloalcanivorax marinus TaxID=1177169 RepID=UPI00195D7F36|nr:ABC transporter permease [Alloalcanivorax marinus]MBM7334937.1 ABC transporter permease [Alloalcanivorax marinus]
MLPRIILASLATRKTSAALIVAAIALSLVMILGIERLRHQVHANFASTVSGMDLIVSARGGPTNILLYSVFHLSEPPAGIEWRTVEHLAAHPQVKWWIPIALGDFHRGFPVVATNHGYLDHYRYGRDRPLELATGDWFAGPDQVVLGSDVARRLGYQPGTPVVLAHGSGGGPAIIEHDDHPFTVSGILAPTGTPVDQGLYISLQAMAVIHSGGRYAYPVPGRPAASDKPDTVNAVMLGLKQRTAILGLQRELSRYDGEPLSAIIPGVELQRLWRMTANVENALRAAAVAVFLVALLVLISTVLAALEGRRHELAVLRAAGAGRGTVYGVIVGESLCLTLAGCATGLLLLFAAQQILAPWALMEWSLRLPTHLLAMAELPLVAAVLLAGSLAGLLPAEKAFRNSLADGLTPRS